MDSNLLEVGVVIVTRTVNKKTKSEWIKFFNSDKDKGNRCNVNDFLFDEDKITILAVFCDCGGCHPLKNDKICWHPSFSVYLEDRVLVRKKIIQSLIIRNDIL
jgi:hypothetical protein